MKGGGSQELEQQVDPGINLVEAPRGNARRGPGRPPKRRGRGGGGLGRGGPLSTVLRTALRRSRRLTKISDIVVNNITFN